MIYIHWRDFEELLIPYITRIYILYNIWHIDLYAINDKSTCNNRLDECLAQTIKWIQEKNKEL